MSKMNADDDFEKELDSFIEHEEKVKKEKEEQNKEKMSLMEKTDKPEKKEILSDNDSEADDYNLTEDQRRALEELDNLKTEMGYPDEEPPEYDVKEKLIKLNAELAEDPTPTEKLKDSKVGFKENLVDLVVPPNEFSDDEEAKDQKAKSNLKTVSGEKEDDKSEPVSPKKSNPGGKKDRVLIEIDGRFEYVDADDVRAKDLGYILDTKDQENEKRKATLHPAPPPKPRPSTANNNSRRSIRPAPKPRPQSAQVSVNKGSALNNFNYSSPYALSPREKQLMEERKAALEKMKQQEERRKKDEDEKKNKENREAFDFWLKKKREQDRRKRIEEEEERKKNEKEDRKRIKDFEANKEFSTYDILYYKDENGDETSENEQQFQEWLREKNKQFKKEKLLKRRQDQEQHEGYYIRSREECDKAYKRWLRQKALEARQARMMERQKNKLLRLAAKRQRKSNTLARSIRESQSFRYVDYYGYRF